MILCNIMMMTRARSPVCQMSPRNTLQSHLSNHSTNPEFLLKCPAVRREDLHNLIQIEISSRLNLEITNHTGELSSRSNQTNQRLSSFLLRAQNINHFFCECTLRFNSRLCQTIHTLFGGIIIFIVISAGKSMTLG